MASIYLRGNIYWVKLGHPEGGRQVCFSLETPDQARASLLAQVAQAHFDLRRPALRDMQLPNRILEFLGDSPAPSELLATPPSPSPESSPVTSATAPGQARTPIAKALAEYIGYVRAENAPRHAANKLSHLRGYFGRALMGEPVRNSENSAGKVKLWFRGNCLEDVRVEHVRLYIESLEIGISTQRHYRETFHHFFEHSMKCNFFIPTNFRYPNPMAALPSYVSKNEVIRFLTAKEKEVLYSLLTPYPSLHAGARLMIEGGLRRSEALWLPRQALADDLSFMSIINQADPESDLESTLKTGSRPVTILRPLREFLKSYLPTLTGQWLVPSPTGKQWIGDNFGDAHREVLRPAGLDHTCLHYRHTYATDRAKSGWSLFRIAKEMGNSVAIVEKYYAAFVNPDQDAVA